MERAITTQQQQMTPPYAPYLATLERLKDECSAELSKEHGLHCDAGDWMDSAVLKLQKPSWTPGTMGQGIFFSVWLGEKELKARRFNYNIHAFKMGELPGHAIKPREFAATFREKLDGLKSDWPNLSIDYGPQTLMQGWMPLREGTFLQDVKGLMDRFVRMHGLIDTLLEQRKRA